MPAISKLNAATASASLNAKYMGCSDIPEVADARSDGQTRHVITTYWLDKEQVMFDVTHWGESLGVLSNSVSKCQKNEGYFIDVAQHQYIKGTKREAYSSRSEWTLTATDYTKITPVPPNDFPIPATPISTFDHVLKYPRCPHNVVGVVVHASNDQQMETTWKIPFKLGSTKCDALLPLELWGTCAQHPIGTGQVIGVHHVYWFSTKGVAIANGNANQVIMDDSDLSPSIREDVTKWAKGFDSKKLESITSHYLPILQLGTPSCKKVFNGNNFVGEQVFNMAANEFGEKVVQKPSFVATFVQEDCIGRWCRISFQNSKNPRTKESIYRVSHFEFLANEEAGKNTLLSTPSAPLSPIECDLQTQMDRLFGWHANFPPSRHRTTSSINAFLRKHGGHFDMTRLLQKCANVELDIDIFEDLISRMLHVTNTKDWVDVLMAHRSNFPFPELQAFLDGMTVRCMNDLIHTLAPPFTPSPQTPNTPENPSSKISVIPFKLPSDEDGKEEDSPQKRASEKKSTSTEKSPKRPCLEKDRAPAASRAQRKTVTPENSKTKTPKMLEVPKLGEANETDDE